MPRLLGRIEEGHRLSAAEWLPVAREAPDALLRELADRMRARLHPDGVVCYVIDRNINYTNVCTADCTYCAFYRKPGHAEGYVLGYDEIFRKVEETLALGGSGILMQGGLHPDLPLDWYVGLLRALKARYRIHLHCFSPPEIHAFSKIFGLPVREVLVRLTEAGLDSIPGGGAEILVDSFRRRRATKCTGVEWLAVMEEAHRLSIPTTATMMFGMGETIEHRLGHLELLRQLQDRTGGFISFIPWTFQPDNTPLGKAFPDRLPAEEYLRWLAICRLYLDSIPNIQVSWLTQGLEAARLGLRSGANDIGSIMIEENVISAAGAHHRTEEAGLRQAIVDGGFTPCKRNGAYHRLEEPRPADQARVAAHA
ncbi:MAG: dehypoxanthine futalosine cyclase [Candidatus Wallbacteria bacterium]|nr:dehypoxanthine futalosine cyclase [Candidatus Wallbacteria bacterium]